MVITMSQNSQPGRSWFGKHGFVRGYQSLFFPNPESFRIWWCRLGLHTGLSLQRPLGNAETHIWPGNCHLALFGDDIVTGWWFPRPVATRESSGVPVWRAMVGVVMMMLKVVVGYGPVRQRRRVTEGRMYTRTNLRELSISNGGVEGGQTRRRGWPHLQRNYLERVSVRTLAKMALVGGVHIGHGELGGFLGAHERTESPRPWVLLVQVWWRIRLDVAEHAGGLRRIYLSVKGAGRHLVPLFCFFVYVPDGGSVRASGFRFAGEDAEFGVFGIGQALDLVVDCFPVRVLVLVVAVGGFDHYCGVETKCVVAACDFGSRKVVSELGLILGWFGIRSVSKNIIFKTLPVGQVYLIFCL